MKSVIAGTIAWVLAAEVFGANYATFAPFSAVLLMQVTIADSVQMAIRYTGAVLVGIALAAMVLLPDGAHLWVFPLMLAAALTIGRWHRLGSQGLNVSVAAIFAFGAFAMPEPGASPAGRLPEIAGMVLVGATVALVINLLIAPPLRYRSAEHAVSTLSDTLTELLTDMADGISGGTVSDGNYRDWRRRADRAVSLAGQVRSTVDHAVRSSKFNPRRLLARETANFDGYGVTVEAMERLAWQLRSVTTGLGYVAEREDADLVQDSAFLRHYAALLTAVGDAVHTAGSIHTVADLNAGGALRTHARGCQSALRRLDTEARGPLDEPTQWSIYGGLFTDAQRLCDEVSAARDRLQEVARTVGRRPRTLRR
ncbi:FUSC family protein [Mycolicibacterium thermoresistibile]